MRLLLLLSLSCCVSKVLGVTPVIFDTDIGTDFDDSAAIALALHKPNLDIKLIVTATGDVVGRAKIVAQYLERVGRTDIPIGIGVSNPNNTGTALFGWSADYDLSKYPGTIYQDGVGAMIDVIRKSPSPVSILAIAPCDNFPSLLERAPDVVDNAAVYAMSGSVYRGYGNSSTPDAEYNVHVDPYGSQVMYEASWNLTTTPLDTCGTVALSGDAYEAFLTSASIDGLTLVESYVYWCRGRNWDPRVSGDIWFDTVAVLLADEEMADSMLEFRMLPIVVTDDGYTKVSPSTSKLTRVAVNWKAGQQAAFELYEAKTIASSPPSGRH